MKVSIVTACFNAAKTLPQTLESVRSQVLPNGVELEHIVVDGGSKDGTVELLQSFRPSPSPTATPTATSYTYTFRWLSEKDRGLYDAINKGIRMATGDVIGICNADDILADDQVVAKIAVAFGEGENLDAIYADIRFVHGGDSVEALRTAPTTRYCTGRFFRNWMFRFATFPAHPSTFVRKACFEKFGYYSLDYRICADFEMMLRLFWKHGIRARCLPICTTVMRTGGLSTAGLHSNRQINQEDLRALKAHGYWSCLPLIYLKYFFKIWGFVFKRR